MKARHIFLFIGVTILVLGLVSGAAAAIDLPIGQDPVPEAPDATASRSGIPDATMPIAYESPADFSQGFDDITTLPGLGWYFQNNSNPLGLTDWFQGNAAVFPAHAGAPEAYIGANFNNTSGVGTISNWMLTPELVLNNGATFSFWTRTATGSTYPDRLQVRLSTAGPSTNVGTGAADVGDFTTLLLEVNPTLVVGGYPEVWTQYTITLSGIPGGSSGRIAFRYYVTDAGPSGSNSNYIGIDTVEFTDPPSIALSKTVGTDPLVCAPTDVITVTVGTEVNYCYTVSNTGGIILTLHDLQDTELGVILDDFPYTLAPGASVYVTQTATINATTVNTATWTAFNQLSYSYDDTIAYNFEDISATGTAFPLTDDSVSGALPLGFAFSYYGSSLSDVYASSNGFLTVLPGQSSGCCTGQLLPTPGNPDGVIAGWWEDMDPGEIGTGLYYQTLGSAPNRRFIVQYTNVQHYPSGNPVTLQYKLFEGSNLIEVHYLTAPSDGGTHSAGLENQAATVGTQYYRGTAALTTPLAVRYSPQGSNAQATASDTALVTVLFPEIDVAPDSLTSQQIPDKIVMQTLTISNLGNPLTSLDWQILESQPVEKSPGSSAAGSEQFGSQKPGSVAEVVGAAFPEGVGSMPSAIGQRSKPFTPTAVLYDNGPLVTHPGGGAGGADASALQTVLGMVTYGFGHQVSAGNRVADDFTITDAGGWTIDTVTFFAYQTGSGTSSTITGVNLRIWDGIPDEPGSNVVWGDTTTNVLANTTWVNIYRVLDTALTDTLRPVMADTVAVGITLPAGTYWLDWQTDGTLASGPWAPPVSILGQTTTGNAKQYTSTGGVWADLVDVGPQGLPFLIEGSLGGCVGDLPWVTVDPLTGTLPGGAATPVDVTFDSTGLSLGVYTGTLCVLSNDPVNSLLTVPLTMTVVAPEYGVDVSAEQGLTGLIGESITYTVYVTNTGNGPVDTFDVTLGSSVYPSTVEPITVGPLDQGQSAMLHVRVDIPADALPGDTDTVEVTATSQGDPTKSDSAVLTTTVGGTYVLSLDPAQDAQSATPGEMVTYTLTLTNDGDNTVVDLSISGNAWVVDLPVTSFNLAAGASVDFIVHVSIPAGAAYGDDDVVTIAAAGWGGAMATSELTTTAVIPVRKVFLPLVMNEFIVP